MAKVTSKLQVTVPKALADQFGIQPGDEIEWEPAGDVIRVLPPGHRTEDLDTAERLRLFEQSILRQRERERQRPDLLHGKVREGRGWTREELYDRGRTR